VADLVRAQERRQWIIRDYQLAFGEVDALVLPVAPIPAPRIDAEEVRDAARCTAYTGAANLAGIPAVPLPAGTSGGLPIAVQILAPAGADALALRIARALEQAAPEHRVHEPPLKI
jgi:aspartyl-tRNA(Asn)/glutamyl-tRNA(Gln) amidotransferase subunit A